MASCKRKLARWELRPFQAVRQIAKGVEVELQPVLRVQNISEQVRGAEVLPELVEVEVVAKR